jgi:excisionase family DNA binding protein
VTDYLTPDDVADITGMSVYTIRAAVRAGELRATRPRRRILIHRDALADWLDASTVRPGETVAPRGATRTPQIPHHATPDDEDDMQWVRNHLRQRGAA